MGSVAAARQVGPGTLLPIALTSFMVVFVGYWAILAPPARTYPLVCHVQLSAAPLVLLVYPAWLLCGVCTTWVCDRPVRRLLSERRSLRTLRVRTCGRGV